MIRYAVAAVPRRDLAGALAVLVVALVALWQWPAMWRSLGLAVVVLVAYAAWAMDEPAAAIVDTTPTSLRRRTVARILALAPALGLWLAFTLLVARRAWFPESGSATMLVVVGSGALLLGAAVSTVQRRRGLATPGTAVASGTGLIVAGLGAFPKHLPFRPAPFPGVSAHEWAWSGRFWAVIAVAAVLAIVLATAEWRSPHRPAATRCPRH